MNESALREILEYTLMEYAKTQDYGKSIDAGVERYNSQLNQRRIELVLSGDVKRELQVHPQTNGREVERLATDYPFNHEEKIEEL